MTPGSEDDHPEEGQDEAEDRDEHHPAQRVRWVHVGGRHQDPHQTAEHLQRGGKWWTAGIMISEIYDMCLC